MSQQKRRFKAVIAGKTYTILGTKSDEHMKVVEELLNSQLTQLDEAMPDLSTEEKMVLLALNAMSEQVEQQKQSRLLQDEVEQIKKAYTKQHTKSSERRNALSKERLKQFETFANK